MGGQASAGLIRAREVENLNMALFLERFDTIDGKVILDVDLATFLLEPTKHDDEVALEFVDHPALSPRPLQDGVGARNREYCVEMRP